MGLVLVIDDEPNILLVLGEALRDAGHEVMTSTGAPEGLARVQREPVPDVVLVDLCMPGMGGRAFVEHLRGHPGGRGVPVLIITAAVATDAILPHPDAYQDLIHKPFDLDDLLARVAALLAAPARECCQV